MKYYSTERKSPKVGFAAALMRGLAPDGGLYMPDNFPIGLEIDGGNFADRASQLLGSFVSNKGLDRLCSDAFNFPVPLRQLSENLFHVQCSVFCDIYFPRIKPSLELLNKLADVFFVFVNNF